MNSLQDNIVYDMIGSIPVEHLQPIQNTLPKQSELRVYKSEDQIKSENIYVNKLSSRNAMGNYIIPIENESVLINLIPSKRIVRDSAIAYFLDNSFQYFTPTSFSDIIPEPTTFANGTIFRVLGEGALPKEEYTYFIIDDGIVKQIPNYKSVEVLLFERGRSLDDIQIIETSVFEELLFTSLVNRFVEQGYNLEQATEEAAKFVVMNPQQPTIDTEIGYDYPN